MEIIGGELHVLFVEMYEKFVDVWCDVGTPHVGCERSLFYDQKKVLQVVVQLSRK
jgi:hypothetical protein